MTTGSPPTTYLWTSEPAELNAFLKSCGQPLFRARQINEWLFKKLVFEPQQMSNLPQALRDLLSQAFIPAALRCRHRSAADDGTVKLLLELNDGNTVEAVIIPSPERQTFCLSTQVGCPVRCRFCASGAEGLVRNLTTAEILHQFQCCCAEIGRLPDNLVFMGIGEGMLNLDHLIPALEALSDADRFGMAARRITVSTSGWTPGILRLAELRRQWNLAVSLHAPDDETRARLIPPDLRRPIAEILAACDTYREKAGRMVTLEYTLIRDENDSAAQAEKLSALARRHHAKVNLIPYNEVPDKPFRRPAADKVDAFLRILLSHEIQATVRVEKGGNVNAACGQLRRQG